MKKISKRVTGYPLHSFC